MMKSFYKKFNLLFYVVLFSLISAYLTAQPGGFISDSDIALWLIADSSVTNTIGNPAANGEEIDFWSDQSANGFLASRVSNGPIFRTSGGADFNNHAVIEFDNTQRYLSVADNDELDGGHSGLSFFVVYKRGNTDTRSLIMKRTAIGTDISYGMFYNTGFELWGYLDGTNVGGISAAGATGSHIGSYVFDGTLASTNRLQLTLDGGTVEYSNTANTSISNYTNDLLIGLFNPGDTRYLNGDQIAEILIIKKALNQAQRAVIENYFSAKYGSAITNDYYAGNDAAYLVSFSGIGQEADASYSNAETDGLTLGAISGFDIGEYGIFAHNGTLNEISTSNLPAGVEGRWARDWYVDKTGTFNSRIGFDFSYITNGQYPADLSNYTLLYRNTTSGNYSEVTVSNVGVANGDQVYFEVSDANLPDGYYTLGSNDTTVSSLIGEEGRSWYTLISGDWSDTIVWTQDPSGTQYVNPGGYTPTTSPTALSDKVYILSGRTVTVQPGNDNKTNASLLVDGRLDLTTTSGHNFGEIRGSGRIFLASDNFPAGDATHFTTAGQGEGTVIYYGNSYNLLNSHSFYNLEIALDNSANTITLLADYTVNGDFTVENGIFKINDNISTNDLSIDINGDWNIESNGQVLTGTANAEHTATLQGNFTNRGTALFTNRVAPNYNAAATDGMVHLRFNNGLGNQQISCLGTTNFYRIEIDKGTDDTYILSIMASDASYFNLFGPANQGHASVAQLTSNTNSLGLLRGTVKIGTNVSIPVLNNTGNYNISESARLWVDGGSVAKNAGTAIVPYGTIQVSNGTLEALVNSGITTRDNGKIQVDGGTLNTYQIRTSVLGASNVGGYIQSGGTVNLAIGNTNADYYKFCLTYPGNVFHMTGGTLNLAESRGRGGIFINSDPEKIKVTGGTVNCDISSNQDFIITSRAPFYNLNLTNSAANGRLHLLAGGVDVGATDEVLAAQPLEVLNNLSIQTNSTLDHDGNDVSIGGNFTIQANADYVYDNAKQNTTTINGSGNSQLAFYNRTGGSNDEQRFWRFVIDKPATGIVTLASGKTNLNNTNNNLLRIDGSAFIINSGILNNGRHSVRFYTDTVINYGVCGIYNPANATPDATANGNNDQIKFRPDDFVLLTNDDSKFGNVRLNSGNRIVTLTSDVYIQRIEWRHGRMDLGTHNLKLDELYLNLNASQTIGGLPSVEDMFITAGNASDGGLSIYIPADGIDPTEGDTDFEFPLGNGTDGVDFTSGGASKYTPALVSLSGVTDDGYITINPVDAILPTANQASNSLSYYWRVRYSDFTALPTVIYHFNYYDDDLDGANENTFRPGKVLDDYPYTRSNEDAAELDGATNTIEFDDAGAGFTLENANYTAGQNNAFTGSVSIFYTRDHGNSTGTAAREPRWTDRFTWTRNDILDPAYDPHDSRQPAPNNGPNSYPQAGDVVVIGWVPWDDPKVALRGQPHGVWIDNNTQTCAEVRFTQMEDISGNPVARVYRSNFQFRPTLCINWLNGNLVTGLVRGEGMFWNRRSDPDFTNMDFGEFASEDSAYVVYEVWDNNDVILNTPPAFPNLVAATDGWGGNNRNFTFEEDIVTNGNFEILGDANVILDNDATGDLTIGRNLITYEFQGSEGGASGGGAELAFQNNGTSRTVTVYGDIILNNAGTDIHVSNPNTPATDHYLNLYGDFSQNSAGAGVDGLQLHTANDQDRVTLSWLGNEHSSFVNLGGDTPELYRLILNKGNSQTYRANLNSEVILGGPTNTSNKALELQNGTLIMNDPALDFTLSSGSGDFLIPGTAALEIPQGRVEVTGTDIGILLDGRLQIDGGTVDLGTNIGNGNNYIEYSSTGTAELIISGGQLIVGSQIRRGLSSDVGILQYTQTGGTVLVGKDAAPEGDRGIFEITGTGSSFTHTGGDLTLLRQQNSPSIASLYLVPDSYSLNTGTSIILGGAATPANQTFGIYSAIPIKNLHLNNSGGNSPDAKMNVVTLTVEEDLTIDNTCTFDASGLDLFIQGDFLNSGTFNPNGNTTTFNGSGTQQISGNTTFFNLIKEGTNQLNLAAGATDLTIQNVLDLQGGTFVDNNNTILVSGDVNNDAIHQYGGTGGGIELNGILEQSLTGNGKFGKLAINNINGVLVPLGNNLTISDVLRLESGVFNIGKNLLDMEVNAVMENGAPFSATNMIQTNISFTDNGVRKTFPANASSFIFPMGSAGKYTPVNFNITANANSTGSITVKPSNEMHPSIQEDAETPSIVDADNVLQYHWVLRSAGISGFSATATMKYIPADVKVTAPYAITDYITARLLSDGSGNWNKFPDVDKFDEASETLIFDFSGTDSDGISGDYTAGITDAIPDVVPIYQTELSGDWTTGTLWDPDVAGGPRGAIARINSGHTIDIPVNFISSYETQIIGQVNVNSTFAHRFGIVNGTGTLYTEREALPAGIYDVFFSSAGGTIEFGGNSDYDILGGYTFVNNITLSGLGDRRLPNSDLTIYGDLTINGSGTLNLINESDRNIDIYGDLTLISGVFDAGTGSSTISLTGSTNQLINGNFKDASGFHILTVDNAAGVTLSGSISIGEQLNLNNGILSSANDTVFIDYAASISPASGTASSFISANLSKELFTGDSYEFPVGDGNNKGNISVSNLINFSGIQKVNTRYQYATPPNPTTFSAPITGISLTEYWAIAAPSGSQAGLTIALDGSSDVANSNDLDSLRLVMWDGTEWVIVGGTPSHTGTAASGTITTASAISFDGSTQLFALASIQNVIIASASFSTTDLEICSGVSTTITVILSGESPWNFSYSDGTSTFNETGITTPTFDINISPTLPTTYTLLTVSDLNGAGNIVGNTDVLVTVNALPVISLTGDNNVCEGETGVIYTTNAGMSAYNWNLSAGALVTSGGTVNDNIVTVTWNATGAQTIDVNYTNLDGCTAAAPEIININVNTEPSPAIAGNDTVCAGDIGIVYTTDSGMTGYTWNISAGGTISAGGGVADDFVTINWGAVGSENITVNYTDANSCSATTPTSLDVELMKMPKTEGIYHLPNTLFP